MHFEDTLAGCDMYGWSTLMVDYPIQVNFFYNFQGKYKAPLPRGNRAINSPTNPDFLPPSARTCGSGALH